MRLKIQQEAEFFPSGARINRHSVKGGILISHVADSIASPTALRLKVSVMSYSSEHSFKK